MALFSSCSPLIFSHADKTTEIAAAIIPVMILHGLHTDSTYHSPLRETFVKDIREDFSNLVHCNLAGLNLSHCLIPNENKMSIPRLPG